MKASTWWLALGALLLFAGCSATKAEPSQAATPTAELPQSDVAVKEEAKELSPPIPAEFAPPFPNNQDFFTPPQVDIANVSGLEQTADGTPEVRVLGFMKVEGGASRAIVQIGALTEIVEAGQAVRGIEVISLQEPTVTLQIGGARWNVNMFEQPKTASLASAGRAVGRNNRPADRGPTAAPPQPRLPGADRLPPLPTVPGLPTIPMPPLP